MLNGAKTVDIKLSTRKIAPYNRIKSGDIMYIKESSGPIVGRVKMPWVDYYEISDQDEILKILLDIQDSVGLDDEAHALRMFERVRHKRYVTVFGLADPEKLGRPIKIAKSDRRVWVPGFVVNDELAFAFACAEKT